MFCINLSKKILKMLSFYLNSIMIHLITLQGQQIPMQKKKQLGSQTVVDGLKRCVLFQLLRMNFLLLRGLPTLDT